MNKNRNILAVWLLLITTMPLSTLADDDEKIAFCDYVAAVVAGTALMRNVDIPIEQARKDLQNNLQKYLPNISVYRVNYLMQLVDAVYKEPKAVSGKKLAATARHGCIFSAYDKIVDLERGK
jgi:hypothetical protein